MRQQSDAVAARAADLWRDLADRPWKFDFYQAMRRIECAYPNKPRLGTALRPIDEPVRLGQSPAMDFAPAPLSALLPGQGSRPPRLIVRFFGLFGANGPLPLHLTAFAYGRQRDRDHTIARFADIFHHRLLLLFYRAWAQAQPTVSADRPGQDRFSAYVGSLIGYGTPQYRRREPVPDGLRLQFAGRFAHRTRNAEGLAAILEGFLRRPVRIEQYVGHWMKLPPTERTRLDRRPGSGQQLGVGVVLGTQVWDRQHKFRIGIGPLNLTQLEALLPCGSGVGSLIALVRDYLGQELEWDLQLRLRATEVPATALGRGQRLGWTSWLKTREERRDPGVLTLKVDRGQVLAVGAHPGTRH
jgi:type VI secretion system protein ImpH